MLRKYYTTKPHPRLQHLQVEVALIVEENLLITILMHFESGESLNLAPALAEIKR